MRAGAEGRRKRGEKGGERRRERFGGCCDRMGQTIGGAGGLGGEGQTREESGTETRDDREREGGSGGGGGFRQRMNGGGKGRKEKKERTKGPDAQQEGGDEEASPLP